MEEGTTMTQSLHTLEEGQRVHYLANLGGLVAIAGLDVIEPSILLAALVETKIKLQQLSDEQLAPLKQKGLKILEARNAEKRSFKSWQRAQQTERFDLSKKQIQQLIQKLGGKLPALEKDLASELRRLLQRVIA